MPAETKEEEENPDVSLISEEDLLTTIFCLCDVERRGKISFCDLFLCEGIPSAT